MRATAKDLRFHSKEVLDTVMRGEEVVITYHGKPTAKLIPFRSGSRRGKDQKTLFGIWKDHSSIRNVGHYVRTLRKGRFQ